MTLSALRDDALRVRGAHAEARLTLPRARPLPLACLVDPIVEIDGRSHEPTVPLASGPTSTRPGMLTAMPSMREAAIPRYDGIRTRTWKPVISPPRGRCGIRRTG